MTIHLLDGAPAIVNIHLARGDSVRAEIGLVTESGDAADLSGFTVSAVAIGRATGVETAFTAGKSGSTVTLSLTAEQTAAMDDFSNYDVQFDEAGGGERVTPITGTIQLLPEFTTD